MPGTAAGSCTTYAASRFGCRPRSGRSRRRRRERTRRAIGRLARAAAASRESASRPAQPPGAGQVEDEVQCRRRRGRGTCRAGRPRSTVSADEGLRRRVVGLEHADRAELDPRDGKPVGALAQEVGERLDLGQLRHPLTLAHVRVGPRTPVCRVPPAEAPVVPSPGPQNPRFAENVSACGRRAGGAGGRSRRRRGRSGPAGAPGGANSSLDTGMPCERTCSAGVSSRMAIASHRLGAVARRSRRRSWGRAARRRRPGASGSAGTPGPAGAAPPACAPARCGTTRCWSAPSRSAAAARPGSRAA